jgi:oligoendopeptidase F
MTSRLAESRKGGDRALLLTLLKSGGNDHPMTQLKKAGRRPDPAAQTMQAVIEQMDRLVR